MSYIVVLKLILNRLAYYTMQTIIVVLSDSENGLQTMLTYLHKCCMQYCLDIYPLRLQNVSKRTGKYNTS